MTTATCTAHHWVIETPQGATSPGVCRKCGEQRTFLNSEPDYLLTSSDNRRQKRGGARTKAQEAEFYSATSESSMGRWI